MKRAALWLAAAVVVAASCAVGGGPSVPGGGGPTPIPAAEIPPDQVTRLDDNLAVGVLLVDGRLDVVMLVTEPDGRTLGHLITSAVVPAGRDSLHLATYGGNTGFTWNTFVYGTAAPGTEQVALLGVGDTRGGAVAGGVWVIALQEKDLTPAQLHWVFSGPGGRRTGDGIFPPSA